jgi:hypothetical protein
MTTNSNISVLMTEIYISFSGAKMHTGGGEGGGGGTSCTPYKDFEKLPHKNAIKTTPPPLIFSQPQVPPSKEFAKNPKYPPPWISNYCASMFRRNEKQIFD